MKTVYVRTKTKDEARKRAEWLYMILRDCTPVIADLHTSKAQVVTESMVIKYVPENYTMDGIRCDIAIGFGQLGKIIATENTCDNLMDERELATMRKHTLQKLRSNWQEQSKQRLTKSGVLKRFTLTMEQRKSSIPIREQKSNLRSMHSHRRTDRFFSVSYTRTVFL